MKGFNIQIEYDKEHNLVRFTDKSGTIECEVCGPVHFPCHSDNDDIDNINTFFNMYVREHFSGEEGSENGKG